MTHACISRFMKPFLNATNANILREKLAKRLGQILNNREPSDSTKVLHNISLPIQLAMENNYCVRRFTQQTLNCMFMSCIVFKIDGEKES